MKELLSRWKDIVPCHEKDYYRVGRWLVSRKLAFRVAVVTCIACAALILSMMPEGLSQGAKGYPTYRYDAFLLKFYSGKAEILAESGYTAYIGNIKKGAVQGKGTLYDEEGRTVYAGKFQNGKYHGKGTLYRKNGAKLYEGEFRKGKKSGEGVLFDGRDSEVFTGQFLNDGIFYETFAGAGTDEASEWYTGKLEMYSADDEICGYMKDIDAAYFGKSAEDEMEGGWTITGLYVLKDFLLTAEGKVQDKKGLDKWFGKAEYAGDTCLELPEVIVCNLLDMKKAPALQTENLMKDVLEVTSWDEQWETSVRSYTKDGFRYTFFGTGEDGKFNFYLIEEEK